MLVGYPFQPALSVAMLGHVPVPVCFVEMKSPWRIDSAFSLVVQILDIYISITFCFTSNVEPDAEVKPKINVLDALPPICVVDDWMPCATQKSDKGCKSCR